ncbi:MAG: hypothetical protein IPM47_12930 [Sphingobacteriales bacterium]|nr:MAG: hypothetical protein IPM47_12930 [Sphingobacteriales bacterium]
MLIRVIILSFILFAKVPFALAQMPLLEVANLTLKIGPKSEEVLYYGFAKGDKIIFTFKEEEQKELTEVSIEEFPEQIRFSDYKVKSIRAKHIDVNQKSVYVFKFVNNQAFKGRVCHIKIQRIPETDLTIDFNSQVRWIASYDTTFQIETREVLSGYDTIFSKNESWELKKSTLEEFVVFDKNQKVASRANLGGVSNRICIRFELPPNVSNNSRKQVLQGWAYWIGVGEEASMVWTENVKTIAGFAQGVIAIYSPLGGLVAGLVSGLAIPKTGDDIYYAITDSVQAELFLSKKTFLPIDWGKGKGGFGKFNHTQPSAFYLCLENDNYLNAVDVTIKVVALIDTKIYANQETSKQVIKPRMEKVSVEIPVITPKTLPVTWK